jgi:hypothetical protein
VLDCQQEGHATPGHHSCSGSPDLSAATGPSSDRLLQAGSCLFAPLHTRQVKVWPRPCRDLHPVLTCRAWDQQICFSTAATVRMQFREKHVVMLCRFSNGSLQALPRSPFAGPVQGPVLRHLYTGSTPAAYNPGLNPELNLDVGDLTPAQQHARLARKWGRPAADMCCGPGGNTLGAEAAQQPLLAAAAAAAAAGGEARTISRINSADDSSADAHGNAHGEVPSTHLTSISMASCTAAAMGSGMLPLRQQASSSVATSTSARPACSPSGLQCRGRTHLGEQLSAPAGRCGEALPAAGALNALM